jgi:malonyl CoA-acyl carrier protein transacylase
VTLDATPFADLALPLVNNWQAREIRSGAEAREGLYHQVPNPVRWVETVRYLTEHGVARAFEVGAGNVLAGLVRAVSPAIAVSKSGEAPDFDVL